ncbi:hypothetical protein TSO5_19890 [Azospirillum sp. TSO5]|nr:hypothetical protein TSO5_19890 [Azospirillum sp. TSO5]
MLLEDLILRCHCLPSKPSTAITPTPYGASSTHMRRLYGATDAASVEDGGRRIVAAPGAQA